MLPWRRPEPSPEEEGVLWGHLARVGARRRPAQPSFELVYSLSVCQLFRLSRFVPDFDVSGKTAEPKMAFNFAHLLSAACGGAPHRLRRLRRPWARCPRAPLWFSWGARLVSLDLYRISTLVAKLRNRKWRLILRTCCPPPAAALRAAWGACGAPLAGGSSVYGCGCARYTTGALWRAPGEHDYAVVASTRERVASIFTKTLGVPSAASIRSDVTVPGAPGGTA